MDRFQLGLNFVAADDCTSEFHVAPCRSGPDGHYTRDATTIELCMKTCREVEGCTGFDWLPGKSFCWLSPSQYPHKNELLDISVKSMAAVSSRTWFCDCTKRTCDSVVVNTIESLGLSHTKDHFAGARLHDESVTF